MRLPRSGAAADLLPARLPGYESKGRELHELLEGLVRSLKPGALLPSERVLAARYGVARQTVRGELERLSVDGLTYRVQGSGTFVADRRVAVGESLPMASFSEEMQRRGQRPGSRVLSQEVVGATPALAHRLEIAVDAPVIRIERVRTADDVPIALEVAHLPGGWFSGLETIDLASLSLYTALEQHWGVRLHLAEQRIRAVVLTADEAALIGLGVGQSALRFETIGRDRDGMVVHYTEAHYRGDLYEVTLRQERVAALQPLERDTP